MPSSPIDHWCPSITKEVRERWGGERERERGGERESEGERGGGGGGGGGEGEREREMPRSPLDHIVRSADTAVWP